MIRMIGSVIAVTLVLSLMPTSSTAADPVEIEAILPLTGQAAFIGKASAEGLKAAENIVNKSGGIGGRPVKFVVADDQSNPQNDVQLANDLIAKHVAVIMGSALVANCLAMVPLMKNGPVLYCLSPALHPDPGSFVFSGGAAASDTVLVAIRYARQRGWTRIATINPTDATGQDADKSIAAALAEPGNQALQIVDQQHFNLTDVSVAAQIAHIQARNPQMVIAWASGTAIGTVFRAINDASYQVPVLTSQANATYAQMAQFAQILPKELYFAGVPSMEPDQVQDRATKRAVDAYDAALSQLGVRPEVQATAYDPALIVVDALRKLGPDATATQLRDYIAGIRNWVGANGPYDFRTYPQRGLGVNTATVLRWDAAKGTWYGVSAPGGAPLKGST
ncbi:MAG: ABC transporter substrate-binding protein [Candidatus Lustribacter sp.]